MGIRVVGVSVVWSGLGWRAYSPRSRLGLPDGRWPAAPRLLPFAPISKRRAPLFFLAGRCGCSRYVVGPRAEVTTHALRPAPIHLPGPTATSVRTPDGRVLQVPAGWILLPPGDPGLTRRVKTAGDHWVVQEPRGRKMFSRGVWAPQATIDRIRTELAAERSTEQFAKRQASAVKWREKVQAEYVGDFHAAVKDYLRFHDRHTAFAEQLATAVTTHATPVGSGTVARTERIPIERRAEAAVIAWMRHQTTAYDSMKIARVKGKRREVRRMLARRSQELLHRYRVDEPVAVGCPLAGALVSGELAP